MTSTPSGKCYLVGAGPGDPGLLTIKGKECLQSAGVVIYDYLSNPELLQYCPTDCECIYVGKKAGNAAMPQDEINTLLVQKTAEGKRVVRLKGGDPFLFGRGGEEAEALAEAGLPFEIVPGVTSAIAGPAYAGIPVTHRKHNAMLNIFTGHEDPKKEASIVDYAAIAKTPGTKVLLMGIARLRKIAEQLQKEGLSGETPIALVHRASTGQQKSLVGTLSTIADQAEKAAFKAPAVAVIGNVVKLREKLNWFEKRPLFGKRIAVTRTRKQASDFLKALRELGADAFELPTIRIEEPLEKRAFYESVAYAHGYDWIIFSSPNGVDAFFKAFYEIFKDARELGPPRIAVIGPATAARVRHFRFQVDLMAETYIAEGLLKVFKKEADIENQKILVVRAEKSRDLLPQELETLGGIVDETIAYRTVPETKDIAGGLARFKKHGADMLTFTSSSTARNFVKMNLPLPPGLVVASIGPATSETITELGLPLAIEAKSHDVPGLVEAICKYYR
ncbi:MAG: uroporphyrinogen-III C-methyltransferase [Chthoniobacterales bacterium]